MLKFDTDSMLATAKVVMRFNPSISRSAYPTPESFVEFMEYMGRTVLEHEGHTFCGTYGFYLTAFPTAGDPQSRTVKATVSPYILG